MAVAKVNNDDIYDIIIASSSETKIFNFTGTTIYNGSLYYTVSTADFNLDGKDDIYLGTDNSYTYNTFLISTDTGIPFTPMECTNVKPATTMKDTVCSDFNNDGYPDIAEFEDGNADVFIRLNSAPWDFLSAITSSRDQFSINWQPVHLATGDLNNDGFTDIFVSCGTSGYTILFNDGNGGFTFSEYPYPSYSPSSRACLFDTDADGDLDIILSAYDGSTYYLREIENTGEGTFTTRRSLAMADAVTFITVIYLEPAD